MLCLQCFDAGGRKGVRPVKNRVVRCWRGCLSGAMCTLAYCAINMLLVCSMFIWVDDCLLNLAAMSRYTVGISSRHASTPPPSSSSPSCLLLDHFVTTLSLLRSSRNWQAMKTDMKTASSLAPARQSTQTRSRIVFKEF